VVFSFRKREGKGTGSSCLLNCRGTARSGLEEEGRELFPLEKGKGPLFFGGTWSGPGAQKGEPAAWSRKGGF